MVMRELVMSYLRNDLSRRGFIKKMTGAGFSAVAARAVLESLSSVTASAAELSAVEPAEYKTIRGTGGEILVEQLRAAGVKFVVAGNSSHLRDFYDGFVDRN